MTYHNVRKTAKPKPFAKPVRPYDVTTREEVYKLESEGWRLVNYPRPLAVTTGQVINNITQWEFGKYFSPTPMLYLRKNGVLKSVDPAAVSQPFPTHEQRRKYIEHSAELEAVLAGHKRIEGFMNQNHPKMFL